MLHLTPLRDECSIHGSLMRTIERYTVWINLLQKNCVPGNGLFHSPPFKTQQSSYDNTPSLHRILCVV